MSRVLVVDDEAPILRALTADLRARKYEWDAAATGETLSGSPPSTIPARSCSIWGCRA